MDGNLAVSAKYVGKKESTRTPYILLFVYLVVEYARPAFMAPIRPALLVQIVLVLFLVGKKERVAQVVKEKYFRLYLALMGLMFFHIFFAKNNYWAYMHFQMMVSYLLIGIAFCIYLDSFEKIKKLLTFFVLILAVCAIDRLTGLRLLGGSGHLGDENDFALAMNSALPISFFLAKSERGLKKWLLGMASVLLVSGTMISASRGGFISLVAVGAGCLVFSKHRLKALAAISILAIVFWTFATPEYREEILGIGLESAEDETGKDRIELWKVGWRAFVDNPIFGVGQGNMPIVMETYQYDEEGKSFWKRGLWGRAIHSVYFTLLPELGLVGLFLFIVMFRRLQQKSRMIRELCAGEGSEGFFREIENVKTALMIGLIGFLVAGVFLSALYYPEYWNFSALILTLFSVTSEAANKKHSQAALENPAI